MNNTGDYHKDIIMKEEELREEEYNKTNKEKIVQSLKDIELPGDLMVKTVRKLKEKKKKGFKKL